MFIYSDSRHAVITNLRCGHTNMYHYFGLVPYSVTGFTMKDWEEHHNSIAVLRNPLERVVSAAKVSVDRYIDNSRRDMFFIEHSRPYMNMLLSCDFRIIDFYNLEEYIPRRSDVAQSFRTDSRIDDSITPQDVYVDNLGYTLQELQQEFVIYKELIATQEIVSVEEWKEMTQ